MTQEDKNLLYKYLCMALPYKVIIQEFDDEYGYNDYELKSIESDYFSENNPCVEGWYLNRIENVKPYLRPMSSMTEEEEEEYRNIDNRSYSCPMDYAHIPASERIDWLNAHHFDYRGLIEKSLAIDVTKGNNPYKE